MAFTKETSERDNYGFGQDMIGDYGDFNDNLTDIEVLVNFTVQILCLTGGFIGTSIYTRTQ